jgi:ERCC4-related helicase
MKKRKEKSKDFLTFFFVPHRSIRDQQVTAIRDVGDLRVIGCDDDSSANEFIHYNHVVVCTPQKFLNCLIDKTILLNQIDLLIFDECHNCIGNHPYSKIMEQYLVYHQNEVRPRIIGLTASCGTKLTNPFLILEELKNEQTRKTNALKKLYELCGTLNCWNVVTITKEEHIEELNNKVPRPTDDRILSVLSLPFDQFLSKLKEVLESLLEYIGSRDLPPILADTNEQKLVEEKQNAEKENNFTNVILIKYMIMFVKRFNALSDLPLKSIFIDIIKKLDFFYT